jgi:hypothetical protein
MTSLCAPHTDVSCFACCPPIRPPGYDALDFVSSLRREFVDNRERYLREGARHQPVIGFSCWALGFLDAAGRRIGCLLHPGQNDGCDLRHLIDYGDKCRRENCLAARVFTRLGDTGQAFWLPLAHGLNSFAYSSPRANPLFHLLQWESEFLERARDQALRRGWTATELLWHHPFFLDRAWKPRGHRYLFRLFEAQAPHFWERDREWFLAAGRALQEACTRLVELLPHPLEGGEAHYVHQLPLAEDLKDFLRFVVGWRCATWWAARALGRRAEFVVKKALGDLRCT